MKFVIYGAGAIGGLMGGRLHEAGHEVTLIARGDNLRALSRSGLRIDTPSGSSVVAVPVVGRAEDAGIEAGDVVVVAVKGQDTLQAISTLSRCAPLDVAIVCAQNGVENERVALRAFPHVYGACVSCNATYLTPGVVVSHGSPAAGVIVLGRYPNGTDETSSRVAAALVSSGWFVELRPDVMRWKYAKLLRSMSNAVGAICGPATRAGRIVELAREEALACYGAADIDWVGDEEWSADDRRSGQTRFLPAGGIDQAGGSSWQSLARRAGSIESDYLNGEIVLLGRLHGVATPVNAALARLATELASSAEEPGTLTEQEFFEWFEAVQESARTS